MVARAGNLAILFVCTTIVWLAIRAVIGKNKVMPLWSHFLFTMVIRHIFWGDM